MSKRHWIIFAATLSGAQYAQAQKDSASQQLDEVVVTANKFPQKESSTGKVLTVIGRQQLERNTGRTIAQVLNEQAGIIVNGAQSTLGSPQVVYMRGAGSANTLILVDGVPANDASGISGEFDINHFSIDQVERIEILKGAQSALYGSDAVAGVINIITRKQASSKPIGINATAAAGTWGTWKGSAGISGKASIFTYNLQYNHLQSDGFSAAQDTAKTSQHFDSDGYKQDEGLLNIAAQVTNNWKLRLFGSFSRYKTDLDDEAFTDDKNNTLATKNIQAGIASIYKFSKNTLTVNLNLNNNKRDLQDLVNAVPNGPFDYDPSFGHYKSNTVFAEAYTNLYLAEHIGLLAGADYRGQKADINTTYGDLGHDSLHAGQASGYATLLLQSLKGFNADLGARYTHHSVFGAAFTWSVNPSYLINRELKVFANIATGFRSPSIYHMASEYGNKNLKPEKSTSLEGGVQYINHSNTLNLRATAFSRDITDVIIFKSISVAPYGQYDNANKQKDNGFELEAVVHPCAEWSITANYAYVDGKIHSKVLGKDTSAFNLFRRPKNAVNTIVGFQATGKLYASIGLRWVDKRQDLFFDSNTFATVNKTLAPYYNLDAYISYQLKSFVKVFADFRNITDQQYFEVYGYNSRRFNFMAGVSVGF